jgi:hypothetical protein
MDLKNKNMKKYGGKEFLSGIVMIIALFYGNFYLKSDPAATNFDRYIGTTGIVSGICIGILMLRRLSEMYFLGYFRDKGYARGEESNILQNSISTIATFIFRATHPSGLWGIFSRRPRMKHSEILPAWKMQKKYGLYAENRPEIKINPENVPENLRDLIPFAETWGIGDDIIRMDFKEKTPEAEKLKLRDALRGRTGEVQDWLDSFGRSQPMSDEAAHFMYMLEALDEMHLWPD